MGLLVMVVFQGMICVVDGAIRVSGYDCVADGVGRVSEYNTCG